MKSIIYGYFTDELDLLNAVESLQNKGIKLKMCGLPFLFMDSIKF
jgi:hypothetical protein